MSNDLVADMLTCIRNAQRAGHRSVRVRNSRMVKAVLEVLKKEGFVEGFAVKKEEKRPWEELEVTLKYYGPHEPVIAKLERISRSGRRVYSPAQSLPIVARGLGVCIVSTSEGVMSDREARRRKLGGELVARVA